MANEVLTKDRTLIAFSLIPGEWDTCSDPQASREMTKFRRSATSPQESQGGRLTYDNLTLTRYFTPARDGAIVAQFKANPDQFNSGVLSLTAVGPDGVVIGSPDTYVGSVESMTRTGGDANSSDQGKLTVVLSIGSGA